jgi:Flp pilus assembly protein TadD
MKRKRKRDVPTTDADSANVAVPTAPPIWILQALVIVATVMWIYWPAIHGQWLWDDALLISDNALVRDPNGWWKIWLQPQRMFDFQPVEVSVVWLEWHLWHGHTSGYHAVSILLHAASALLVWRLLAKLGLRWAWLGGLFFAVHPVMVESVAWMAELKNTLSLPPFLLAMGAWLDYNARGKRSDYFYALGLFLVAMLCKTSMAMFPLIILLYAWARRGRVGMADLKASGPFFAVSIAVGLLALWLLDRSTASMGIEVGDLPPGDFVARFFFAGSILAFYFTKSVCPFDLMPVYPKWSADYSSLSTWLAWIVIFGAIAICWVARANWGRWVLLGIGFFLLNLAPFLGLNAGPYMGFTWVTDHILYLPIIGLIGLAVAGAELVVDIGSRLGPSVRYSVIGLATLLVGAMTLLSHVYAGLYRDSEILWTYALQKNPDAWPGYTSLGAVLLDRGDTAAAEKDFRRAVALVPDYAKGHAYLGLALGKMGRIDEALAELQKAVQLNPTNAGADSNLGTALLAKGRVDEAIDAFRLALKMDPTYEAAHMNLALALKHKGDTAGAMAEYRAVLATSPDNSQAHLKLAELLMQTGDAAGAAQEYDAALRNDPHYQEYRARVGKPQN